MNQIEKLAMYLDLIVPLLFILALGYEYFRHTRMFERSRVKGAIIDEAKAMLMLGLSTKDERMVREAIEHLESAFEDDREFRTWLAQAGRTILMELGYDTQQRDRPTQSDARAWD